MKQWRAIRQAVLVDGMSKRQAFVELVHTLAYLAKASLLKLRQLVKLHSTTMTAAG
jgi:hypothetical protein